MAVVIKNNNPTVGYYTGSDWSRTAADAQQYKNVNEAREIIRNHGMAANAVEEQIPDQPPNQSGGGAR